MAEHLSTTSQCTIPHIVYILKLKEQLLKIQKLQNKQTSNLRYSHTRARTHTHTRALTHTHTHCPDV